MDDLSREIQHDEPAHDHDNICESVGCDHEIHIDDRHCELCEQYKCSVCGDPIGNVYAYGREHMCVGCRDKTVAICTCVSDGGDPITYDESCLRLECQFIAAMDYLTAWKCSCCGQTIFVSHDRDGKMLSLHEREKELSRMATFYGVEHD